MLEPKSDPFEWFDAWLEEAKAKGMADPNAMALSTVGADGMPSSRMVLLKERTPQGFIFYTNFESRKGGELGHGMACLLFYWRELSRQIRIEGTLVRVADEDSDLYFSTRPRLSQIGAWASMQSRPLESREHLLARVEELEAKFEGSEVPRPPHWGGTLLIPSRMEFWQAGEFRLHDRFEYLHQAEGWSPPRRLYP